MKKLGVYIFYRESYAAYQMKRVGEVDDDRLKFETSTVISKEVRIGNFFNVEVG